PFVPVAEGAQLGGEAAARRLVDEDPEHRQVELRDEVPEGLVFGVRVEDGIAVAKESREREIESAHAEAFDLLAEPRHLIVPIRAGLLDLRQADEAAGVSRGGGGEIVREIPVD